MDFKDFVDSLGMGDDDRDNSPETEAERREWWRSNSQVGPLMQHMMEGVESGHISATQMIEGVYTLLHPDASPQALDVMPFFAGAVHALGEPAVMSFFHSMHVIHIPGAFALLCSTHAKIDCPCGTPPTRSFSDMTKAESKAISKGLRAVFASVIPDELHTEDTEDGDFRIVRYTEDDIKDKPDLVDKLVANWRREIDAELPTIIPDHEKPDEPGGEGWMSRWM